MIEKDSTNSVTSILLGLCMQMPMKWCIKKNGSSIVTLMSESHFPCNIDIIIMWCIHRLNLEHKTLFKLCLGYILMQSESDDMLYDSWKNVTSTRT